MRSVHYNAAEMENHLRRDMLRILSCSSMQKYHRYVRGMPIEGGCRYGSHSSGTWCCADGNGGGVPAPLHTPSELSESNAEDVTLAPER